MTVGGWEFGANANDVPEILKPGAEFDACPKFEKIECIFANEKLDIVCWNWLQ
jgi:hypothetical protein